MTNRQKTVSFTDCDTFIRSLGAAAVEQAEEQRCYRRKSRDKREWDSAGQGRQPADRDPEGEGGKKSASTTVTSHKPKLGFEMTKFCSYET